MEDYVDKIGGIKPKHFKNKDLGDIKGIALKELGSQTKHINSLHDERTQVLHLNREYLP